MRPLASLVPFAIVAPHPDDETLGCGGLIALACRMGAPPTVITVTDGGASHPGSRAFPPAALSRERRAEQRRALRRLGHPAPDPVYLGVPDGRVGDLDGAARTTVVLRLREHLEAAATVFVTAADDRHPDHRASAALVAQALDRRSGRATLMHYQIWPASRPGPARSRWSLDIAEALAAKTAAVRAYRSQLGELVHDVPGFAIPQDLLRRALGPEERFDEVSADASRWPAG